MQADVFGALCGEPVERCGQRGHGVPYIGNGGPMPSHRHAAIGPRRHDGVSSIKVLEAAVRMGSIRHVSMVP